MTTHGGISPGRRRWAFTGAAIALTAGVLAGCGSTPLETDSYSTEDPLVLRYADYTSAISGGPFQAFADEATAESDGRIKFKQYWGGSLLGTADMPAGIRGGVADLGMFTATYYGSEFPLTEWISDLGSVSSTDFPDGILQANAAQADFAMKSDEVNEQFQNRNIKLLFSSHSITKYDVICNTPVESLADAKGKRVRSGGALWDRELAAAGMIPVNVDITETYEGLQRGVIDCALASPKTVTAYGLWDVAKYYTEIPLSGINAQYAIMNLDQWDSLEPEDRQIVWEAGYTWWLEYLKYEGLGLEEKLRTEGVEDKGVNFLKGEADLVNAIEEEQAETIDQMPASAPASVEDPQAIIDEYEETMDVWFKRVQNMNLGSSEDINLDEYEKAVKSELWERNQP